MNFLFLFVSFSLSFPDSPAFQTGFEKAFSEISCFDNSQVSLFSYQKNSLFLFCCSFFDSLIGIDYFLIFYFIFIFQCDKYSKIVESNDPEQAIETILEMFEKSKKDHQNDYVL